MKKILHAAVAFLLLIILNAQLSTARGQGTAFTYQGRLNVGTNVAGGTFDLTFTLYNAVNGGVIVGTSNVVNDLPITNGLFTVSLDFGASAFNGGDRWLEIAVRPGVSTGAYTNLVPRQPVSATPYALFAAGANASTLVGSIPSSSLAGTYNVAVTLNNSGNVFAGNGSNLTALNASQLTSGTVPSGVLSNAWKLGGNTGANPTNGIFLGTTDNQPLEFKVNGQRALRLQYVNNGVEQSVNVIGGYSSNFVAGGVVGATISGGGQSGLTNRVTGDFGAIGGGEDNTAGSVAATIGGGSGNTASDRFTTIGGGSGNTASGRFGTIGGGSDNIVGANSYYATVPGGDQNIANGWSSFAAGHRAQADHDGAFVWADSTDADFASTGDDQFLIRASGGVAIGTANPAGAVLRVAGNILADSMAIGTTNSAGATLRVAGSINADSFQGANVTGDETITGSLRVDSAGVNNGAVYGVPALTFGTSDSGEGIASKRTAGGNQFGLDFYTGYNVQITLLHNGNLGIGRTPTANKLEVEGNASKTAAGSWLANSDRRIKQDIAPVAGALDTLNRVRLVSFRYTDDYRAQHPSIEDRPYLNVIAQEFAKVFPDAVKSSGEKLPDGSAILQVDTYPLTIYSAAAIQELDVKQRELRTEKDQQIGELKSENAELRARLEKLEQLLAPKLAGVAK